MYKNHYTGTQSIRLVFPVVHVPLRVFFSYESKYSFVAYVKERLKYTTQMIEIYQQLDNC